jgi:hypothetical protein
MLDANFPGADPPILVRSQRNGEGIVDAVLAACPEIAALDHAREGWLHIYGDRDRERIAWAVSEDDEWADDLEDATPVLVVPKPEASS